MLAKKILNYSTDYYKLETQYSNIFYTDADELYIDTIKRIVDVYYPILVKDFKLDINKLEKLKIIIYPTKKDLENAINVSYVDDSPMGVYYGGIINLLSIDVYYKSNNFYEIIDFYLENGPIIHELTHHLLDIKTKGNYNVWLSEGLALYYENKYTNFEWRKDLSNKSSSITLKQLEKNFNSIDSDLAYRKSYEAVKNYIDQIGESKFQDLLIN